MKPSPSVLLAMSLILAGCASGSFGDRPQAKEGFALAAPVVSALRDFKQTNGAFPRSLQELSLAPEVEAHVSKLGLAYVPLQAQGSYALAFGFPAVPFLSVRCTHSGSGDVNDWVCLGK